MKILSFRDLKVWQKAHELALLVYRITERFPPEEKYGLTSQMRRAAVSVATNIVEGFRRRSAKDSLHFYDIANASLEELRYEALLASDLRYLSETHMLNQKLEETSRMLNAWIKSQWRTTRKV